MKFLNNPIVSGIFLIFQIVFIVLSEINTYRIIALSITALWFIQTLLKKDLNNKKPNKSHHK